MNTMDFLKNKTLLDTYDDLKNQSLLSRYSQLNDKEKNELYRLNSGLVYQVTQKIYSKSYQYDSEFFEDLIMIGFIGLEKAFETFKVEYKVKFYTYASKCVYNEILMYLRKYNRKIQHEVLIDTEINQNQKPLSLESTLPDLNKGPREIYISKEENERLYQSFYKLTREEQEFLLKYYGLGGYEKHNQVNLSKEFQISQASVSRKQKKIVKKLYEFYEDK